MGLCIFSQEPVGSFGHRGDNVARVSLRGIKQDPCCELVTIYGSGHITTTNFGKGQCDDGDGGLQVTNRLQRLHAVRVSGDDANVACRFQKLIDAADDDRMTVGNNYVDDAHRVLVSTEAATTYAVRDGYPHSITEVRSAAYDVCHIR